MLAPAFGRHVDQGAFEQLQQPLLYPFARYVAGDGGVVALAGDLVELIDENDAPFGLFQVVIGCLQQARQDAFHVFAHIARLGEHRGVDDGQGHVEHA